MLLHSLPPIVHIRRESDKAAMRWSLERMREELRDPQPGSSLIAQQLAYMMLIQALRLHLTDTASAGRGWLSALADKHMSLAIACMHNDPGFPWTLQSLAERVGMSRSVFALRFRETVERHTIGIPHPLAHASDCRSPEELLRRPLCHRARSTRLRVRKRLWQSLSPSHGLLAKAVHPDQYAVRHA